MLRSLDTGKFILISEYYIHGIIDGEIIKEFENEKYTREEFIFY